VLRGEPLFSSLSPREAASEYRAAVCRQALMHAEPTAPTRGGSSSQRAAVLSPSTSSSRSGSSTAATSPVSTASAGESTEEPSGAACSPRSFLAALLLEEERLRLGLTARQRDAVLLELDAVVSDFDPTRWLGTRTAAAESQRRKGVTRTFRCQEPECGSALSFLGQSQCQRCYRHLCQDCMSGAPPVLLPEWESDEGQRVCQRCHNAVQQQYSLMAQLRRLSAHHRMARAHTFDTYRRRLLLEAVSRAALSPLAPCSPSRSLHEVGAPAPLAPPCNLAVYPQASVLASVPTARHSPPIESVLFGPGLLADVLALTAHSHSEPFAADQHYWSAPQGHADVQLFVCLSQPCTLRSLRLHVDALGYTAADLPRVRVLAGRTMSELHSIGVWTLCPADERRQEQEYEKDQDQDHRHHHHHHQKKKKTTTTTHQDQQENGLNTARLLLQPHSTVEYVFPPNACSVVRVLALRLSLPSLSQPQDATTGGATSSSSASAASASSASLPQRSPAGRRRRLHLGRIEALGHCASDTYQPAYLRASPYVRAVQLTESGGNFVPSASLTVTTAPAPPTRHRTPGSGSPSAASSVDESSSVAELLPPPVVSEQQKKLIHRVLSRPSSWNLLPVRPTKASKNVQPSCSRTSLEFSFSRRYISGFTLDVRHNSFASLTQVREVSISCILADATKTKKSHQDANQIDLGTYLIPKLDSSQVLDYTFGALGEHVTPAGLHPGTVPVCSIRVEFRGTYSSPDLLCVGNDARAIRTLPQQIPRVAFFVLEHVNAKAMIAHK